jgi:hypothetical protein
VRVYVLEDDSTGRTVATLRVLTILIWISRLKGADIKGAGVGNQRFEEIFNV